MLANPSRIAGVAGRYSFLSARSRRPESTSSPAGRALSGLIGARMNRRLLRPEGGGERGKAHLEPMLLAACRRSSPGTPVKGRQRPVAAETNGNEGSAGHGGSNGCAAAPTSSAGAVGGIGGRSEE